MLNPTLDDHSQPHVRRAMFHMGGVYRRRPDHGSLVTKWLTS